MLPIASRASCRSIRAPATSRSSSHHPRWAAGRPAESVWLSGTLRVTTVGSNSGAALSVHPRTGDVGVVSQGGLLWNPACVTAGSDGALYVGDLSANSGTGSSGSIVRLDASGAQSVFANGVPFQGPFDIAISSDGWIWSAQWGWTSRRNGGGLPLAASPDIPIRA